MSDLTEMGKSKRLESGCTKRLRKEETATYQSQERHVCSLLWGREMITSLLMDTIKSRDPMNPHTAL